MNFVNLTPHAIVVKANDEFFTFRTSGKVARVNTATVKEDPIGVFAVRRTVYGEVVDLPEPCEHTRYIVSAMVLARCPDRTDLLAPDTGPSAIRNEQGHIAAVTGFVR